MSIILTEEQRLLAENGQAVEVVDSTTNQKYMVTIQRVAEPKPLEEVPEGIRLSIEAFKRDLPELLSNKKTKGRWVAYNRVTRLGIARTGIELEDILHAVVSEAFPSVPGRNRILGVVPGPSFSHGDLRWLGFGLN